MSYVTDPNDALVYARQSADRTGDELAVGRQTEDCTALARNRGLRVVEVIQDNDTSASGKVARPGFDKLLKLIESGRARIVIAWDLTRLTRNARDTLRLLEVGEKYGVTIALVRGSDMDLSTPAGRLTASVLASVARHEIEQKSDRQKRAAQQSAAAGLPTGGRRPFGYEQGGMILREDEASALRQAYEDCLLGISLGQIAKKLNDAGLPTPQLTREGEASWWTSQTIGPVLLNPRYAGLRARSIRPKQGRPYWEHLGVAAAWPAVVSEETWRAVRDALTDPARRTPGGAVALLTGAGLCGVCGIDTGATVHQGRNNKHQRTYRCSVTLAHIARRADPVDQYIGDVVVERLSRPDATDLLQVDDRPDVAGLREEAVALRERLHQVATEFAEDDTFTPTQLRVMTTRLRERLGAVEAQLVDAGRVDVLGPLIGAADVAAAWEGLGTDRQRAVVNTLMTVVLHQVGRGTRTFRPETVQVIWKIGD